MPKKVSQDAIVKTAKSLEDLPDAPPRTRKAHKRPNRRKDTIRAENIKAAWAEDTDPGNPKVNFQVRIDADLLEWYNQEADRLGKDRTVLARLALKEYKERNS